jgi:hypothetical protein
MLPNYISRLRGFVWRKLGEMSLVLAAQERSTKIAAPEKYSHGMKTPRALLRKNFQSKGILKT